MFSFSVKSFCQKLSFFDTNLGLNAVYIFIYKYGNETLNSLIRVFLYSSRNAYFCRKGNDVRNHAKLFIKV